MSEEKPMSIFLGNPEFDPTEDPDWNRLMRTTCYAYLRFKKEGELTFEVLQNVNKESLQYFDWLKAKGVAK